MPGDVVPFPAAPDEGPPALQELERRLVDGLTANPLESLVAVVTIGAALFYWCEGGGRNELVTSYWDALEYCATSLSVGYSRVFPVTPGGKLVASIIQTIGPSLSARALDPPRAAEAPDPTLAKLDEILVELRRIGGQR